MPDRKSLFIPIVLIAVGIGWLLSTLGLAPQINWIWTLGLASIGLLTFLISGIDKATVVVGTLLILASILSVLRQTGRLVIDHELPIMVIASGVLLLVARSNAVSSPKWFHDRPDGR